MTDALVTVDADAEPHADFDVPTQPPPHPCTWVPNGTATQLTLDPNFGAEILDALGGDRPAIVWLAFHSGVPSVLQVRAVGPLGERTTAAQQVPISLNGIPAAASLAQGANGAAVLGCSNTERCSIAALGPDLVPRGIPINTPFSFGSNLAIEPDGYSFLSLNAGSLSPGLITVASSGATSVAALPSTIVWDEHRLVYPDGSFLLVWDGATAHDLPMIGSGRYTHDGIALEPIHETLRGDTPGFENVAIGVTATPYGAIAAWSPFATDPRTLVTLALDPSGQPTNAPESPDGLPHAARGSTPAITYAFGDVLLAWPDFAPPHLTLNLEVLDPATGRARGPAMILRDGPDNAGLVHIVPTAAGAVVFFAARDASGESQQVFSIGIRCVL